ncbi:MAG: tRNA (adenosine(37)-N6)-threonylcarbamoyltransferase complex dimerization subunit type 1 TsaB [Candidatus Eisenbacteria bacterium]|nr:tRNA (adenosine(37)-N6)-threonylcarbamoyltransferase complex dimerization subunit type 1 TsaB [Candidatus Eisenbacteria bacterium]
MKVLGIETATMTSSVALVENGTLVAEHNVKVSLSHSERLIHTVNRILEDARVDLESVDGVAISIGPGSFTGVRIGVGTAKALSYAARKLLLPVPTLEGMAFLFQEENALLCPVLDARRGEVYSSLYRREDGMLRQILPPFCGRSDRVIEAISSSRRDGERVVIGGPGLPLLGGFINETGLSSISSSDVSLPRALGVALRGEEILLSGQSADPLTLVPLYVRPSDAETKLGRRIDE